MVSSFWKSGEEVLDVLPCPGLAKPGDEDDVRESGGKVDHFPGSRDSL